MATDAQQHPPPAAIDNAGPVLIRPADIEQFLRYYDGALDASEAKLALFALPGATTFASRDLDALARRAAEWAHCGRDVYFHTHLHHLPEGELRTRGTIESARVAIGLFSDIDARGPARKKPPEILCPRVEDAIWIVEQFNALYQPLRASALAGSGYGCYPMVLLKEPFLIESPEDRLRIESLGRRFHESLHRIAAQRGWTGAVDYCDPAKVLRLPGCANYKDAQNPKPVRLVFEHEDRFTISDLEDLLPPLADRGKLFPGTGPGVSADPVDIVLNLSPTIKPGLLAALSAAHPLFTPTWQNQRPDLKDQSCSGIEMALAALCVECGLTDRQIADLLVVHRQQFPSEKQDRRGAHYLKYLERTITKARAGKQSSKAAEQEWAACKAQVAAAESQPEPAGDNGSSDFKENRTTIPASMPDAGEVAARTSAPGAAMTEASPIAAGEPHHPNTEHSADQQTPTESQPAQKVPLIGRNTTDVSPVRPPDRNNSSAKPQHPYQERNGCIVRVKEARDGGETIVPLTNFTARITSNISEDDGVEVKRFFGIDAELAGKSYKFILPANKFAPMDWPIENIAPTAIVHPAQKDWARAAVQTLSDNVVERQIYTHTGWRRAGETMLYLHGDGAIGPNGAVADIDVRLSGALVHYALILPESVEQLVESVRASLHVLEVAPDHISCPLLAAAYRACLKSCDFAVWLGGPTGVFKSELAALAQQHYGEVMNARRLPGNFASTGNSLEVLAFSAKDALLVIDDFAPHGGVQDINRYHGAADRIIRAAGNNQGRGRLSSDARLREAKPPRGLILATGEDVPRGQSIRGRTLIIEISPTDVNTTILTECQMAAANGIYARAMGGFVQWVARQYDKVQAAFQARVLDLRSQATKVHNRTPGIVADLHAGFELSLEFAADVEAITSEEKLALQERCWTALNQVARSQRVQQDASEPARRFVELLRAAILSGQAYVADLKGDAPGSDGQWGWQLVGSGDHQRLVSRGKCVGWLDGPDLYLEPTASYSVAQELGRTTGEPLFVGQTTLKKRLREKGLLASTDIARETLTVRRRVCGEYVAVIHLHSTALGAPPEGGPDKDATIYKPVETFEC